MFSLRFMQAISQTCNKTILPCTWHQLVKKKSALIEFQNAYQNIRRQQEQMYSQGGGEVSPQILAFFRQQAIQGLVDQELMLAEAEKAGITVTDEEAKSQITAV